MKLFEDLPSTNTPINAENLNQIKDSLVVVSPTEPTGDAREKVWIQKGKNLFNKEDFTVDSDGYIGFNVDLEFGKTYTISSNLPLSIAKFSTHFSQNNGNQGPEKWNSFTSWTFVAGNNANNYLNTRVFLGIVSDAGSLNIEDFKDYNIQIEEGSTATEYEDYVEPKVYIKNDNDIYEGIKPRTNKILDVTDNKYNLKTRVFKNGETVQIFLFCTQWGEALNTGHATYQLAKIPEKYAPMEDIIETITTSTGDKFTVRITTGGNIMIEYVYNTLEANSVNQIAKNITFLCK